MQKNTEEYVEQLEETIGKFLKPIEGLPFHVAIKGLYDTEVRRLDLQNDEDLRLVKDLSEASKIGTKKAYKEGIFRKRRNEVGNDMEGYLEEGLKTIGLNPQTPKREDGKRQARGYPDIYVKDRFNRHTYVEVKTYSEETIDSSQRAFYFSPPKKGKKKVIYNAPHVVASFNIERDQERDQGNKNCYIPVEWKILSIYSMKVKVKHEFNASYDDIYRREAILDEGKLDIQKIEKKEIS